MFDAAPFYSIHDASTLESMSGQDVEVEDPLRFRGTPDSLAAYHLEGSECCLIHYDNAQNLTSGKGVYINPFVRVGYNAPAYVTVNDQISPDGNVWPSFASRYRQLWALRVVRHFAGYRRSLAKAEVKRRIDAWKSSAASLADSRESRDEPGHPCLIDEMQVLAGNGWAHV
jgi:hypothetical protein